MELDYCNINKLTDIIKYGSEDNSNKLAYLDMLEFQIKDLKEYVWKEVNSLMDDLIGNLKNGVLNEKDKSLLQ